MDVLDWDHPTPSDNDADREADREADRDGGYELAALNLHVLRDSMRRGDVALRRSILAHWEAQRAEG